MAEQETLAEDHAARSAFVRSLVQRSEQSGAVSSPALSTGVRRKVVQFWDDLERLPHDVAECIASWKALEERGFEVLLFNADTAMELIASKLRSCHQKAFERCYHPAMQSDYFRLCYVLLEGGCYVDADDVYNGTSLEHLFEDDRLKVQPLCYDIATERMVSPEIFTEPGAYAASWIFYFNNNPLIAGPGHPIVERALSNATAVLERTPSDELPEIQSTSGPGNLTRTIFELAQERVETTNSLRVLNHWAQVATSRWPLSYRGDARNWRLSNRRKYHPSERGNG